MVDICNGVANLTCPSGISWCYYYATYRQKFWHYIFRPVWWRRSNFVPTHSMVLRSSRSVHHRSARFWYYFARHCYVLTQTYLWIFTNGLGVNCDWRFGFRRLGSSHVHGWNVVNPTIVLYVGNHGNRSPNWC